ncbi:MAG TPA: hypothetical protein VHW47_09780 [Acidimicrobiales bacterium]|nr:hypothetical protein [Acidimicrobiales bacterium]
MFAYYGSKEELAHLYPEPSHETIIEPFAGSAAYARHGDRWRAQVVLVEPDPQIVEIWHWLIGEATPEAVMALPEPAVGDPSGELSALTAVVSPGPGGTGITPETVAAWRTRKPRLAASLHKVKHWRVLCGSYGEAPDMVATWFVDPPYQGTVGGAYRQNSSSLTFGALADWVRTRQGQVIACEGGCADYLPFEPLRPGVDRRGDPHAELVWSREARPG